jgi:hypothetical protein
VRQCGRPSVVSRYTSPGVARIVGLTLITRRRSAALGKALLTDRFPPFCWHGELFMPELQRIRGEILQKTADERGAVEAFCRSIELADQQSALSWRLRHRASSRSVLLPSSGPIRAKNRWHCTALNVRYCDHRTKPVWRHKAGLLGHAFCRYRIAGVQSVVRRAIRSFVASPFKVDRR